MSAHSQIIPTAFALLVLFLFLCGCVSSNVGDISLHRKRAFSND